ncbi:hypothetical protein RI129_003661 [Pyrocoelia pectoralis]|uniref:Uncharacterized protein n=1 Tax=Pyrocoelia pectoralis TaxID=417401 RepID=A0AAN7VSA7_9COLE
MRDFSSVLVWFSCFSISSCPTQTSNLEKHPFCSLSTPSKNSQPENCIMEELNSSHRSFIFCSTCINPLLTAIRIFKKCLFTKLFNRSNVSVVKSTNSFLICEISLPRSIFPCDEDFVICLTQPETAFCLKVAPTNRILSCTRSFVTGVSFNKLVIFDESRNKVYVMVVWSFAYTEARKGPWQTMALDRYRFHRRIEQLNRILSPVLQENHRAEVYRKRFQGHRIASQKS